MSTDKQIYEALKDIGMPMSLAGYDYITQAIKSCMENPSVRLKAKDLYSQTAEQNGIPVSTVVRNIVYCIQVTVRKSNRLEEYFGSRTSYDNIKPAEFIAAVCEHIHMENKEVV